MGAAGPPPLAFRCLTGAKLESVFAADNFGADFIHGKGFHRQQLNAPGPAVAARPAGGLHPPPRLRRTKITVGAADGHGPGD